MPSRPPWPHPRPLSSKAGEGSPHPHPGPLLPEAIPMAPQGEEGARATKGHFAPSHEPRGARYFLRPALEAAALLQDDLAALAAALERQTHVGNLHAPVHRLA